MGAPIDDYIRANRDRYPREELTAQTVAAGHDRAAVDAAWTRVRPNRARQLRNVAFVILPWVFLFWVFEWSGQ